MDQLTVLAELSRLRLLRDLAALSRHRREIDALNTQADALRQTLRSEGGQTAERFQGDHATARAYGVYANFARHRLTAIKTEKQAAAKAEATCFGDALRAHGRCRAVALLQKKAQEHKRATATRRDEANSMGVQAKPHGKIQL